MNRFNRIIHIPHRIYRIGGGKFQYISSLIYRLIRFYYHCDIPWQFCTEGIYFNHKGFGVVINPNSKVGKGCKIQHSVTIGETEKGCPIIGENCIIGARAVIIGNITIGNNVTIGAGSIVVKDVPENSIIAGVPAKVIRYK